MIRIAVTRWLLAVSLTAFWCYFTAVVLSGRRIAGLTVSGAVWLGLVAVAGVAFSVLSARFSEERRRNLLALCVSLLFSVLVIDTTYTLWINVQTDRRAAQADERLTDPHLWHGELFPRSYFPSEQAFTLYKPNVRVEGVSYGEFYEPRMLQSPTLVREALQLRPLVYTIDGNGLRNRAPIGQRRLWALGDSFVMGYSTTEGFTWGDRFGELTGQAIYNLGVSATGPGLQVQLLDHLLRNGKDAARPERLLWMLFEGNDLENTYVERRSLPPGRTGFRALFQDTLLADLVSLPATIRRRSVIGRVLDGRLPVGLRRAASADNTYEIDGVRLGTPVYHSERWGYCMFNRADVEAATKGEAYVQSHPNRAQLDLSFERMRVLAQEFGFRVTVMMAPSAPRIYAHDFPAMPQPATVPYFMRYVEGLARRKGFDWVDLLGPLSADHSEKMLYYCDDHHWNEHGNDVVARILAERY
jgi:hypothetical protein